MNIQQCRNAPRSGISYGRAKEYVSTGLSPSLAFIPYCHQTPFISKVLLRGWTLPKG